MKRRTEQTIPRPGPALSGRRRIALYAGGSFGTQVVLVTVVAYLPPLLERRFQASALMIGVFLAMAPLTGLLVQPVAGWLSDRTRTRWGRRLPYMLPGALLASVGLWGLGNATTRVAVAGWLVFLFLAFQIYAGPYLATLGEEFDAADHTRVTGAQGVYKGGGALLALVGGGWLFAYGAAWPFRVAAGAILVSGLWSMRAISRRPEHGVASEVTLLPFLRGARGLQRLAAAHFCWWFALHSVFAFTVLFVVHELYGVHDIASPAGERATSSAGILLGAFVATAAVAAVPVSRLAGELGKKRVLGGGLACLGVALAVAGFATRPAEGLVLAVLGGIGFSAIQVIPFAMMLEMQPAGHEGSLAGIFQALIDMPQVVSLVCVGALITLTGSYRVAYWVALCFVVLAAALLRGVPAAEMGEARSGPRQPARARAR